MNLLKSVLFLLLLYSGGGITAQAQTVLTLQDAVKIALENNYEIKISKNDLTIDNNNVSIGNAGMLPTVAANVIDNNNNLNLVQTRIDGTVNTLDGARNNNFTYGVGLGWTIFDGFRMFARYEQLQTLKKLGEAELKLAIITRVSDVNTTYYDLVQQQQQLIALDSSVVISKQRVQLAQNRYTIGKASKLEVLNAKVDLNTDMTALLRQKELHANTKIVLNQILARDAQTDFTVNDGFTVDKDLKLNTLKVLVEKQNPVLEAQILNKRVAELELKRVKGTRYPMIRVNSAYNFSENEASLGFITQSSAKGLNYGFTATLNLFDGFNQNRNEKNAKMLIENATLAIAQQNLVLSTTLSTFYQTYVTNIKLSELEEDNEKIAKQNLDITLEKFKIGTINTLEFRTAQLNYINAKVRKSNVQFQAKISEVNLKELAGNLSF